MDKELDVKEALSTLVDQITNTDTWVWLITKASIIILILIGIKLIEKVGFSVINQIMSRKEGSWISFDKRRVQTLDKLLKNILSYTLSFIGILMILAQLGIELMPIIAGAGVIGLAVAFGAQNLVRDVITGFFIIFEDQFAVGDVVRIKTYEGRVLEIGLRITKLQSKTGEIHIIPNGSIVEVTNFSTSNSIVHLDIKISTEVPIQKAIEILNQGLEEAFLQERIPELTVKPHLLGVQALGAADVTLRIQAECKPNKQSKVHRELNALVKEICDSEGIKLQ